MLLPSLPGSYQARFPRMFCWAHAVEPWLKTKPHYGQAIKEGLLEWRIEAKWQIESVPRLPSATSHSASGGKFRPPRPTNTQSKQVSSVLGWSARGYGALSDLAGWYTEDIGSRTGTRRRASAWPILSIASQEKGCEEAVDRQRTKLYREALFHVLACQKMRSGWKKLWIRNDQNGPEFTVRTSLL